MADLDKYLADGKLTHLAQEVLEKFAEIHKVATSHLEQSNSFSAGTQAYPNHDAFIKQVVASRAVQSAYEKLRHEPAVARIIFHCPKEDTIKEYYICRSTPPTGVKNLASYYSPLGRLAELEFNEKYDMGEETGLAQHNGKYINKVQHALFTPNKSATGWDSRNTSYRDINEIKDKTITSLRKLLEKQVKKDKVYIDPQELLKRLLNTPDNNEGIKKEILENFTLRDQKIMDSRQGEIFRLPVDSSLFLLGPAGTGKTTTLIKRLKLKLELLNLDTGLAEEEKNKIRKIFSAPESFRKSWIMFTPTELLKSYLKEAFNREGIPAPEENIATWSSYRYELGRSVLRILKTATFESGFEVTDDVETLKKDFSNWQILHKEFYQWLLSGYTNELKHSLEKLFSLELFTESQFATKILELISKGQKSGNIQIGLIFKILLDNSEPIYKLYKKVRDSIQYNLDIDLVDKLQNDKSFLSKYYEYISYLDDDIIEDDESEDVVSDIIEDEESTTYGSEKSKIARKKYSNFILWLSTKQPRFNPVKSNSKNARIFIWLKEKLPAPDILESIRKSVETLKSLTLLYNPLNKFFNSIAGKYGKFRRQMQAEGKFYQGDSALRKKIDFAELDLLIFTKLNFATYLLYYSPIPFNEALHNSSLKRVNEIYKAQVFVDEAPDFTPLQLGCMKLLAHPRLNSFFACGDFNQRLCSNGAKNTEEIEKFFPDGKIRIEEISIPYRQTNSLYKFSSKVLEKMAGQQKFSNPQKNDKAIEGFKPVLGEHLKGEKIAAWLAQRIVEIEKTLDGGFPSTAILVPSEEYVARIARALKENLPGKTSIQVQACHEGQTSGDVRAIRVFDIAHIKGLEFEAAFFVSLDKLADLYPDLLTNYLYVGATRAAQFLGVTCESKLPDSLKGDLWEEFDTSWQ